MSIASSAPLQFATSIDNTFVWGTFSSTMPAKPTICNHPSAGTLEKADNPLGTSENLMSWIAQNAVAACCSNTTLALYCATLCKRWNDKTCLCKLQAASSIPSVNQQIRGWININWLTAQKREIWRDSQESASTLGGCIQSWRTCKIPGNTTTTESVMQTLSLKAGLTNFSASFKLEMQIHYHGRSSNRFG